MNSIDRSRQQLDKELYRRDYYLWLLTDLVGRPGLIVIKWQRRTGKSSVVISFLQQQVIPHNKIFLLNKEYDELSEIKTSSDLSSCFDQFVAKYGDPTYIVIDEIQDIVQREIFIRSKNATWKYSLFLLPVSKVLVSNMDYIK